jgi:hypothetical protein
MFASCLDHLKASYIFFYQNVTKIEAVIQVMAGTENGCDQSSLGAYL